MLNPGPIAEEKVKLKKIALVIGWQTSALKN